MTINEMKEKKKKKDIHMPRLLNCLGCSGNSAEDFFWGNRESAI